MTATNAALIERIRSEIAADQFYAQNFSNDGQRFVAWYLRRVMLLAPAEVRQVITDGQDDKQIDAIVVDDDNQRIVVIQGKFLAAETVDGEPLREVLGAWMRLQDLQALQQDCNDRLKERLEAVRRAVDDDYEMEFELLTTGILTPAADSDLSAFTSQLESVGKVPASLHLVNTDVIETRLAEAEAKELPTLTHEIQLDPDKTMITDMQGTRSVITAVPLSECLKIPGITDGRLFRKNVRQSLGSTNKVNRGMRATLYGDRVRDFFFYHNGITALCSEFQLSGDKGRLRLRDLSVVNGCQSLTTIYSASQRIRALPDGEAHILFRFYEIPQRELADRISVFTNSQSAVKPRDLRSNDPIMLGLKRSFEAMYPDGLFITQRGTARPADKDAEKTVDCADLAKALIAWQCQRPNIAHNERRVFDEHYKTLFRPDYDPRSILALQTWLNAIDKTWNQLSLNEALKVSRSSTRFHLLFAVSTLIAHASGQGDKIPHPQATLDKARSLANDILPLAVNCLNQALDSAQKHAQLEGRGPVFSPQNWAKSGAGVQAESLVASTMTSMLPGIGAEAMLQKLRVPPDQFGLRWSAD